MQGLGNHFVIVDGRETVYRPSKSEITRICDVRAGIGGDQLLVIEPPTASGLARGAHALMRIFDVDGKESEACGNATRCVGWLILEETGQGELLLETISGMRACTRRGARQISVDLGPITNEWQKIPLAHAVDSLHLPLSNGILQDGVAANIGNPHVTFFVPDLAALDVAALAQPILQDPLFPNQVNVGLAEIVGPAHLRFQAYERPGILTAACGTGACVATRAAQQRGLIDRTGPVRVEMGAGQVEVLIAPDGSACLTGPVEFCFSGHLTGEEGTGA